MATSRPTTLTEPLPRATEYLTSMKEFPPIPRIEEAPPDLFESGHLWIQEKVDGAHFRFRLLESGMFEFGDRNRVFDPSEIPVPYQHAVRHVRERVDRETLRSAVTDVESVVFFGEATHRHTIDYDWDRIPSVLGFDVWDSEEGRFLPPDTVEQIYDRLGLDAVNALEKEVRASYFDPESYKMPPSAWYDGPAEGVVIRSKTGERAKLSHPEFEEVDETVPLEASAEERARTYTTESRVQKVVHELEAHEYSVSFDAVYDRVVEDIAREEHRQLFDAEEAIDLQAFRSVVAERTQQFLDSENT